MLVTNCWCSDPERIHHIVSKAGQRSNHDISDKTARSIERIHWFESQNQDFEKYTGRTSLAREKFPRPTRRYTDLCEEDLYFSEFSDGRSKPREMGPLAVLSLFQWVKYAKLSSVPLSTKRDSTCLVATVLSQTVRQIAAIVNQEITE